MTKKPASYDRTHNGKTIRFDAESFKFHVPSLDSEDYGKAMFDSVQSAMDVIDKENKAAEIATRRKLDVNVLDMDGESYHVTGVHATNFTLISKPPLRYQSGASRFYPDTVLTRQAFAWMKELQAEINCYRAVLDMFEISSPEKPDRSHPDVTHTGSVCAWERLVNRQTAAATKANLPDAFAKSKPAKRRIRL